jgi:TolB protein
MPAQGGPAERVTFSGTYNISPAVSPDGRWLAYVSRLGGAFRLHLMELSSGQVTALTDTSADERPSFAPNSRMLVYATVFQGRESLMTTTLDRAATFGNPIGARYGNEFFEHLLF